MTVLFSVCGVVAFTLWLCCLMASEWDDAFGLDDDYTWSDEENLE